MSSEFRLFRETKKLWNSFSKWFHGKEKIPEFCFATIFALFRSISNFLALSNHLLKHTYSSSVSFCLELFWEWKKELLGNTGLVCDQRYRTEPWCRNADAWLKPLTNGRNADAGITFFLAFRHLLIVITTDVSWFSSSLDCSARSTAMGCLANI